MGLSVSPTEICTATVAMLSEDICLSELTWFDYTPTSIGAVFDVLPVGVVDFDVNSVARFGLESGQGLKVGLPAMTIDIFVPIKESDVNGRQANRDIWRYWWCLVTRLRATRYYGKTVDQANISGGNVEGIPVETQETGLLARWAWLNIDMEVWL